jgi:hypothetical protein
MHQAQLRIIRAIIPVTKLGEMIQMLLLSNINIKQVVERMNIPKKPFQWSFNNHKKLKHVIFTK